MQNKNHRVTKQGLTFDIRPIEARDNLPISQIIIDTLTEFGATGPGYAIQDKEVESMFEAYQSPRHCYFIIHHEDKVVGGGGIGPLEGGESHICELKKMYFLPMARGLGLGGKMIELCLEQAHHRGYTACYLETLERMHQAQALYQKFGFRKLEGTMGNTGHFSCDSTYFRTI